jgi:hypothetical protein
VFEVSLEGLGAFAQDIEALITGKTAAAQQEKEDRPSSSQAQSPQQQGVAPTPIVAGDADFNIRQAERHFALLEGQIASALPQQHTAPPPATPAPAAATQAALASQQHVCHTLQPMQAQLDQWRQQKDASQGQSIGQRQEHRQGLDNAPFYNIVPVSPLSVELESAPWPCRFNANTLPQYDGDYDPKEFLVKIKVAVESNGGDTTTEAKALVMTLKGEVQYWYANISKGHISSWFQLRNKLLSSFKGMQVEELDSNDLVNMCIQGDKESLQKYMHRVVKLTARAPRVSESSTIDAIVGGLRVGNCQVVLDRIKPKSLQELFEVMQEYYKSDKGHRRRLDEPMQPRQKSNRVSGIHQGDGRIIRRSSHTAKSTMCLHPLIKTRTEAAVDTKEGTRTAGDRNPRSHLHHIKGAAKGVSVGSMGSMHTTTRISALRQSRRK